MLYGYTYNVPKQAEWHVKGRHEMRGELHCILLQYLLKLTRQKITELYYFNIYTTNNLALYSKCSYRIIVLYVEPMSMSLAIDQLMSGPAVNWHNHVDTDGRMYITYVSIKNIFQQQLDIVIPHFWDVSALSGSFSEYCSQMQTPQAQNNQTNKKFQTYMYSQLSLCIKQLTENEPVHIQGGKDENLLQW